MPDRIVTLRLDAELYEKLEILVAERGTSISELVTEKLVDLVEGSSGFAFARAQALEILGRGFDLGTHGTVDRTRDDLHER